MGDNLQIKNNLLDALVNHEYKHLLPQLERVELSLAEVIYEAESEVQYVYFPETAVVSLLSILENGATTEVGLIGREGMVVISTLYGVERESKVATVQRTGSSLRMGSNDIREELAHGGQLERLLLEYAHALMSEISQSVVCNVYHKIDVRLVRWLLMFQDRAEADEFELTHEFMANMLGVTRSSVGEAVRNLQGMGIVSYDRGHFRILNRMALEQMACECYDVVRDEFARLYKNSPDEKP